MTDNKKRMETFGIIMKHPKLSKVIGDAFDAPVGSTKRTQAIAIIDSIDKVHKNKMREDGRGGTSLLGLQSPESPERRIGSLLPHTQSGSFDRLMIFPSAPPMVQYTGKQIDNILNPDPFKELSAQNDASKNQYDTSPTGWAPQKDSILSGGLATILPSYSGPQVTLPPIEDKKPSIMGLSITGIPRETEEIDPQLQNLMDKFKGMSTQPTKKEAMLHGPAGTKPRRVEVGSKEASQLQSQGWGLTPGSYKKPQMIGPKQEEKKVGPAPVSIEQQSANKFYNGLVSRGIPEEEAVQDTIKNMGIAPTISIPKVEKKEGAALDLGEMAAGELSPEAYKNKVLSSGIQELKRLFPGVDEKYLPVGAILSGKLADLSDIIKKETRLKEWEEAAKQQIKSGKTLIPDTEEYIRKRDETIGNIDKMLDDTRGNIIKTSDPQERAKMVDYTNFLGVLRGRQNQSYTAFLNQNIDAYNKESDRVTEQYNKAKDLYNEKYQREAAITTEVYNSISTMLSDTWKQAHELNDPKYIQDIQAKNEAIIGAKIDNIRKTFELSGVNNVDYTKEQKDYDHWFLDTKSGNLLPSDQLNLLEDMTEAVRIGKSPQGVVNLVGRGINKSIQSYSDFSGLYHQLNGLEDQIFNLSRSQFPEGSNVAKNLLVGMYDNAQSKMKEYLKGKKDDIKNAIKDLAPVNWLGQPKVPMDKESWIKTHSEKGIDRMLLEDVYDSYQNQKNILYPNDPQNSIAIFTGLDERKKPIKKIDDNNINIVIDNIYKGIKDEAIKRLTL